MSVRFLLRMPQDDFRLLPEQVHLELQMDPCLRIVLRRVLSAPIVYAEVTRTIAPAAR